MRAQVTRKPADYDRPAPTSGEDGARRARRQPQRSSAVEEFNLKIAKSPPVAPPLRRRVRTFAFDPSLATDPSVAPINVAVLDVR